MICNFENCCRLCLAKDQLLPIFSHDEAEKLIAPKILYCYSLFVYRKDPFSKHLCFRCLSNLQDTWKFQQMCFHNNEKLIRALKEDPSVKCSEQYLKSVENASKTTSLHSLLSCKSLEEVDTIYRGYESIIDFSVQIENVELIDICSEEEDSKEQVRSQINSRSFLIKGHAQTQSNSTSELLNCSQPDSTTKSWRRSFSSEISDDTSSSCSGSTSKSQNTGRGTGDKGQVNNKKMPCERKSQGVEQDTKVKSLRSTRKTEIASESKSISTKQSELRSLRPLLKKDKSTESVSRAESPDNRSIRSLSPSNSSRRLSAGSRSRRSSISNDFDADSLGSIESLNSVYSEVSTNSTRRGRARPVSPLINGRLKTGTKKRKLETQSSNHAEDYKVKEEDLDPPAKRLRHSHSEATAVPSSVSKSNNLFSCKYCKKGFNSKCDKKEHSKICHEKKIINCKYCLKRMYREDDLLRHNLCHVKVDIIRLPRNRHSCSNCHRYFYPKVALRKHKRNCRKPPASIEIIKPDEDPLSSSEESDSGDLELFSDDPQTAYELNGAFSTIPDNPNCRDFRSKRMTSRIDLPLGKIDFSKSQPISHGLNMETSENYVNTLCKYCRDVFTDAEELWKHMVICHKYVNVHCPSKPDSVETLYRCIDESCKKKFSALKDLLNHVQLHISLKCHHCEYSTHKFWQMLRHANECEQNPEKGRWIKCCNLKFNNSHNFYIHKMFECSLHKATLNDLKANTIGESVKCSVCSKHTSIGSEQLLLHLLHHAESNVNSNCQDAEIKNIDAEQAEFVKIFGLAPRDINIEKQTDTLKCIDCNDTFLSSEELHDHMKKCLILSCSKCKLNFSDSFNFIVHECVNRCKLCLSQLNSERHVCLARKILTSGPKGKLKCTVCKVVLVNLLNSRYHILQHFPVSNKEWRDNVKCQICEEELSNELTLNIHYYLKHPSKDEGQQGRTPKLVRKLFQDSKDSPTCNLTTVEKPLSNVDSFLNPNEDQYFERSGKIIGDKGCQTPWFSKSVEDNSSHDLIISGNYQQDVSSFSNVNCDQYFKSYGIGIEDKGCQTSRQRQPLDTLNIHAGGKNSNCSVKTPISSPKHNIGDGVVSQSTNCISISSLPSNCMENK
nr:PREDICTED: uncharacterized protein LOC109032815 [Bemisia tabaci]